MSHWVLEYDFRFSLFCESLFLVTVKTIPKIKAGEVNLTRLYSEAKKICFFKSSGNVIAKAMIGCSMTTPLARTFK
ncbi:hypothetical protein GCM10019817_00380 [Lactobacillus intestinalis]